MRRDARRSRYFGGFFGPARRLVRYGEEEGIVARECERAVNEEFFNSGVVKK